MDNSNAQRKNIEIWRKQTEELKRNEPEEVINERDDENENSENDIDAEFRQYKEVIQKLEEENDILKCQLAAVQNETMFEQLEHQEKMQHKNNQLSAMQTALQNSTEELRNICQRRAETAAELKVLRAFKRRVLGE